MRNHPNRDEPKPDHWESGALQKWESDKRPPLLLGVPWFGFFWREHHRLTSHKPPLFLFFFTLPESRCATDVLSFQAFTNYIIIVAPTRAC